MKTDKGSYKQILKATSMFGGVQVFNILISVIKTKVAAILMGATGLGLIGLFSSTIKLVVDLSKVGLDISAVKEISEYNSKEDRNRVSEFIVVLNKVIWFTGLLGAVLTIFFSKWLSIWTFGNDNYTFEFRCLSVVILVGQLSRGISAMLQGTYQLKKLAKANLLGAFLGLLVSLPLYYFFGTKGIVPAIIIAYVLTYLVFLKYSGFNQLDKVKLSIKEVFNKSKSMLLLGLTMSFTSLIVALTLWLIQVYIRTQNGVNAVGMYSAGIVIINSYVGMVFNAMGTDYFPRLSAINADNSQIREVVNKQAEVSILLITPIIAVFITFASLIIKFLYTDDFLVIQEFVTFGILGTLFKAVSFCLGYVIIAKGHSRVFIKTAVVFNILMLLISVFSYRQGGLTALGIGLMVYYLFHLLTLKVLAKYLYGITLNETFYRTFITCCFICLLCFLATFIGHIYVRYTVMVVLSIVSVIFTLFEFNKRIDIKATIRGFLMRHKKKK